MIKFLHLRNKKFNGQILTKGGITAAYQPGPTKKGDQPDTIKVAFSFCSSSENYSRQRGRDISQGRLLKDKPSYTVSLENGETMEEAVVRFVNQIGVDQS